MSVAKEYFSSTLLISFSQPTRHEHLVDTSLPHLVIGRDGRGGVPILRTSEMSLTTQIMMN